MAKWGYLARAYAIKEFAYMKECEAAMGDTIDESLKAVSDDISIVLEIAEDNDDSRTIKQCRKWLKDFRTKQKEPCGSFILSLNSLNPSI